MKILPGYLKYKEILIALTVAAGMLCSLLVPGLYAESGPTFTFNIPSGYSATLQEGAPLSWDQQGASFFQVNYSPQPPAGTTITLKLSSGCEFLTGGGKSAFARAGQTYSVNDLSSGWGMSMTTVDDTVYEGTHTCKLTGTLTSGDPVYNGLAATPLTFTILDNETAPEPKPATTTTTPKTTAPKPAAVAPKPPDPISADTVKINDSQVPKEGGLVSYDFKQSITLTGKTVPSGLVTLYIYSEPKTAQVNADAEGNWSHTISDIEPGDHRVEGETKDPTTGLTSARTELAKFAVKSAAAAIQNDVSQATAKNKSSFSPALLIIPLLLASGAAVFSVLKLRNKH